MDNISDYLLWDWTPAKTTAVSIPLRTHFRAGNDMLVWPRGDDPTRKTSRYALSAEMKTSSPYRTFLHETFEMKFACISLKFSCSVATRKSKGKNRSVRYPFSLVMSIFRASKTKLIFIHIHEMTPRLLAAVVLGGAKCGKKIRLNDEYGYHTVYAHEWTLMLKSASCTRIARRHVCVRFLYINFGGFRKNAPEKSRNCRNAPVTCDITNMPLEHRTSRLLTS
jgi:hypothetical protein